MKDELDGPIEDIDSTAVLAEQQVKGANINSIDHATFAPANKMFHEANKQLEVLDRRTMNSKTFEIAKNTYRAVFSRSDVHFMDKDTGVLKEINLLVREKEGKLVMTNAAYKLNVFTDKVGYRLKLDNGTGFKIELVKIGKEQVDFSNLSYKVEGNRVYWYNITTGISMYLIVNADRPEIFTVIDNETSPRKFKWKVTQTGDFNLDSFGEDAVGDKVELLTEKEVIDGDTFTYTEEWTGRVARIPNKKTRVRAYFNDPVYPVKIDPTANLGINANGDDGFEKLHLNWFPNSVYVGWTSTSIYSRPGLRFSSIAIAAGVTVTSATLSLTVRAGGSGSGDALSAKVWGHNADNPGAFSTSSYPSDITKTTNSTTWNVSRTVDTVNNIDVTSQVTQILGRAGWASGNAMRFAILTPTGAAIRNNYERFYDYSTTPAKAATLTIDYTGGGGSGPVGKLVKANQGVNRSGTY